MLKALFDYLASELSLTEGQTWHLGSFPPNAPDNGTALGEFVGAQVDPYNPDMAWPRVQILTRNTSYVAGTTEANRIADIVLRLRGVEITGFYIFDTTGSLPAYIGKDEKGRHVFSANVSLSAGKE